MEDFFDGYLWEMSLKRRRLIGHGCGHSFIHLEIEMTGLRDTWVMNVW
jgi:hypothetical protein